MPTTLSIEVPNTATTTTLHSPPGDVLKWTHDDRTTKAARDLVTRGGVDPHAAAAAVTLARNASGAEGTPEADAAALMRLVPTLLATSLTEGEQRFAAAVEAVDLSQWDALARAADWSQQFITAFYRVRQAREEAARAVKRKREAVAEAETEAQAAARLAASEARLQAEADAPEAFVAFALDARPKGEALPTLTLSYKRFSRFNREGAPERIEEDAFVAQAPLLLDDFRRYALARYPELAALPNAHQRKAELFKLWRARQDALTRWCEARGRIASYAEFQTLHKERCARRKLRLHDAWADYTKTWDRLAGMALSARRRTAADAVKAVPSDASQEEEEDAPRPTPTTATEEKPMKKRKANDDDDEKEEAPAAKKTKKTKAASEDEATTTTTKTKADKKKPEKEDDDASAAKKKEDKPTKPTPAAEEEEDDEEDDDDDDFESEMPRRIGGKAT